MINSKQIALMTLSLFFILSGFASCKQTSEETDWTLPASYYEKDPTPDNPNPFVDNSGGGQPDRKWYITKAGYYQIKVDVVNRKVYFKETTGK